MNHTNTHNLHDINDIRIDKSLPPTKRAQKYISDGYNPYRFTVDGTIINIRFNNDKSLNTCLANAFNATLK